MAVISTDQKIRVQLPVSLSQLFLVIETPCEKLESPKIIHLVTHDGPLTHLNLSLFSRFLGSACTASGATALWNPPNLSPWRTVTPSRPSLAVCWRRWPQRAASGSCSM